MVPPGSAPPVTVVVGELADVNVTEAIVVELLLHVPPPVASVNMVVSPEHTAVLPVIGAGNAYTVTDTVCVQPVVVRENVI